MIFKKKDQRFIYEIGYITIRTKIYYEGATDEEDTFDYWSYILDGL